MSAEVRLDAHAAKQFERAPRNVQADLRAKARRLAEDPQAGTYIAPRRIPKTTMRGWRTRVGAVDNAYKLNLAGGWRALYTIGSDGPLRVVLVLAVLDHRQYERLLGHA